MPGPALGRIRDHKGRRALEHPLGHARDVALPGRHLRGRNELALDVERRPHDGAARHAHHAALVRIQLDVAIPVAILARGRGDRRGDEEVVLVVPLRSPRHRVQRPERGRHVPGREPHVHQELVRAQVIDHEVVGDEGRRRRRRFLVPFVPACIVGNLRLGRLGQASQHPHLVAPTEASGRRI